MSGSKHIEKIAWIVTAVMLVITVLFMNGTALGLQAAEHTLGYENRLFDNTKVHTMDIVMNDWDSFISNATSEEYYTATIVIDGESYKNVAIRGKGNTSLSTVSSLGSQRYSFKVEFDHYEVGNTYHGLDKLSLNNLIQDSTMMKDYLTYTMMTEFDADAPLCSFVYITVNGEDWGLYLAVEGLEDSFLERNYGSDYGELYKPDSMSFGGGRGNGKDFDMSQFSFDSESDAAESGGSSMDFDPSSMFGGEMPQIGGADMPQNFDMFSMPDGEMPQELDERGKATDGNVTDGNVTDGDVPSVSGGFDMSSIFGGGFGMGSSDVKLQYIDDDIDSYTNIWNNAKTDVTKADKNRLIASLKQLSQYENVEEVVDVENVIRYFVVHNYVCNGDSYTGTMIHNYYLYEKDGQLNMLPWDYNLAYGTFQGGNATSTVNTPIDKTASGGSTEGLPMLHWIFESEEYTELYHQYFADFLATVDVQGMIDNAYALIAPYVAKDPTAFFTYEEFETGVATMKAFCRLRSESITMQLANGETTSNMQYVTADDLNLSDMGSMGGGMGGGFSRPGSNEEGKGSRPERSSSARGEQPSDEATTAQGDITELSAVVSQSGNAVTQLGFMNFGTPPDGEMPDMSNMPEGFDMSQMPEGFDMSQFPEGFGNFGSFGATEDTTTVADGDSQPSDRDMSSYMGSGYGSANNKANYVLLAVSVLVLAAGLVIAKKYKY